MHSWSTRPALASVRATLVLVLVMSLASTRHAEEIPAPPLGEVKVFMSFEKMHRKVDIVKEDITKLMHREANERTADDVMTCFKNKAYGCKPARYMPSKSGGIEPVYDGKAVNLKMIWSFFDCVKEHLQELTAEVPNLSTAGSPISVDWDDSVGTTAATTGPPSSSVTESTSTATAEHAAMRGLANRKERTREGQTDGGMLSVVRRNRRQIALEFFCNREYCCEFVGVGGEDMCIRYLCSHLRLSRGDLCS